MEEENQVFGKIAEAVDNDTNLKSEDFYFYNQNKEEAKKNIDRSSKELTDFIDSLIQDVPAPSDEDISAGIEKILKTTHPEENQLKTGKKKKVTFKVLFIAALLSILSVSCLFVVGSNHNISIENGFVAFAKDTIQIVFFGKTKDDYITVDTLLINLKQHGYGDILFPQEFITNSDEYKVSVPEYVDDLCKQVSFNIYNDESLYSFVIHHFQDQQTLDFLNVENAKTLLINDIFVYIFEFDNDLLTAEFYSEEYRYYINSITSYSKMDKIIKTIK